MHPPWAHIKCLTEAPKSASSPDRLELNPTLPHLHSHPIYNGQPPERCALLDLSGSSTEPAIQPVGRRLPIPGRNDRYCTYLDVLTQPPQTDTNAQGQSTTTVWRAIRANKEDRVAKLEWAPGGGLGRAVIGKVRLSPQRIPHLTCFLRSHLITEHLSNG